jgi:hypothetical protein
MKLPPTKPGRFNPSWDILLNAFHTVFHAGGGDGFVGRRLPVLLRADGVQNSRINRSIRCKPHDIPSASMSCHIRRAP